MILTGLHLGAAPAWAQEHVEPAPPAPTAASADAPVTTPPPAAPDPKPGRSTMSIVKEVTLLSSLVLLFGGGYALADAFAKGGRLDSVCLAGSGASQCPQSAASAISDYNTEMTLGAIGTSVGSVQLHVTPFGVRGTF
jgi:hypothetical protein